MLFPGVPKRSLSQELGKIIIFIVIAVAIAYLMDYLLSALSSYFPEITHYLKYIKDAIGAVLIFGFAIVILRSIKYAMEAASSRPGSRNLRGIYTVIRAVVYAVAITVFLFYIGVSLTGAVLGGTIGGLVIAFALQNTISNILSGLLLTSSGIIKPEEPIEFYSWLFNNPVVGYVKDVGILTTRVETYDGLNTELPNTGLLGQSQFTNLRRGDSVYYPITLSFNPDVPVKDLISRAEEKIDQMKGESGITSVTSFFTARAFNSNTVKVILKMADLRKLNAALGTVNGSYDAAYWELKKEADEKQNKKN